MSSRFGEFWKQKKAYFLVIQRLFRIDTERERVIR